MRRSHGRGHVDVREQGALLFKDCGGHLLIKFVLNIDALSVSRTYVESSTSEKFMLKELNRECALKEIRMLFEALWSIK